MVSPSAQAAAIDNIGYSSIRAADKLLFIVIGHQSLVTDPCSPIPAIGSAGFAKRIQSAGPSSEGCQVLDKDCLMIVNGEVYLSPPLHRPNYAAALPTLATTYNPPETMEPLLGRSWALLRRSWDALGRLWDALGHSCSTKITPEQLPRAILGDLDSILI